MTVQVKLHCQSISFYDCFQSLANVRPGAELSKSVLTDWISYDFWYLPGSPLLNFMAIHALLTSTTLEPCACTHHGKGYSAMTVLPNSADFNRGLDLFNRAHFFDAHEALEDVWRSIPRDGPHDRPSPRHLRRHVQGLVQLAVAFHHASKDNHVGARSVLERALRNLDGADTSFPELDLDRLRIELAPWQRFLDEKKLDGPGARRHATPALPKILRRR
jgi:predicted metal-dependent hydrolase